MSYTGSAPSLVDSAKLKRAITSHRFTNNKQFIFVSLAYTITIFSFKGFSRIANTPEKPTIIHQIICYIVVGLPFTYLQILMGQYTQLGTIFFKHMSPLGHGLSYVYLLNTFAWCCTYGLRMHDCVMYLLACISQSISWMECPENSVNHCWNGNSTCKKNCLNKNVSLSTTIYWKRVYAQISSVDMSATNYSYFNAFPLCACWFVVFFLLSKEGNKYGIIRANHTISLILFMLLFLLSVNAEGSFKGLEIMFTLNSESFYNVGAWSRAVLNVIRLLGINQVGYLIYGSYMERSMPSDVLTNLNVFINFIITFMTTAILHATVGIIMHAAYINQNHIHHLWEVPSVFHLIIIPAGLGLVGVPKFWTGVYFFACILVVVSNIVTHMDNVEKSILDGYPSIRVYRKYVLATLCILATVIGFILSSGKYHEYYTHFYYNVLEKVECLIIFIMPLLACWIYSVQRICDDIHFLQGSQPTKFWKLFWYILPVTTGTPCIYFTFISAKARPEEKFFYFHYAMYFIMISPIPILLTYQILRYLKIHNLIGILLPEERWGPPDPEERHLRRLFNPRQEIKSRRRDETCQHNCLLRSKFITQVSKDEKEQRANYFKLVEENKEDKDKDVTTKKKKL